MFEQNNFYQQPFGFNQMGMQPQQMAAQNPNNYRIPSTLTADEIKMLRNQGSTFSLGLTQEEMLRAVCNHRSEDGLSDTLQFDPVTGIAKCTVCGYEFRPIDPNGDFESLKEDIKRVEDILQTSKLMYVDLPIDAAKEYYPIIGLLEKLPQFVEYAAKNMAKHDNMNYGYNQHNMGAAAMLQNLSNMFSSASMNYQAPQQPQMNPGFYGQQPAGFPQAAYQPQMNPFGYQGTAPAAPTYAPGTPANFAYTPQQTPVAPQPAATPATTAAPAADATVKQTVMV